MKQILLTVLFFLAPFAAEGQTDTTYYALIQPGKSWHVHHFDMGMNHIVTDYVVDSAPELIGGLSYFRIKAYTGGQVENYGLFRETNQQVYVYNEIQQQEVLIYDFTLHKGDIFEFANEYEHLHGVVSAEGEEYCGGHWVRTLTISFDGSASEAPDGFPLEVTWVAGYGNAQNFKWWEAVYPNSHTSHLAYVVSADGNSFFPLEMHNLYCGWRGRELVSGEQAAEDLQQERLHYELLPSPLAHSYDLHVYGYMCVPDSPHNYIYCIEDNTDPMNVVLSFQIEELPPLAESHSLRWVDLSFPFFEPVREYRVFDATGEHRVVCRDPQQDYRPFVEDGKVWNVGWLQDADQQPRRWESYTLDRDTIIQGQTYKAMLCLPHESGEAKSQPAYAGAFREEGRRVYYVAPAQQHPLLLYDFSAATGDSIIIDNPFTGQQDSCVVGGIYSNYIEGFKGRCMTLYPRRPMDSWKDTWMEGVGNRSLPMHNFFGRHGASDGRVLMSCTVGDEVLYRNPDLNLQSFVTDAKKRLDFTHVVKSQPQIRRRSAGQNNENIDQLLTGDYSQNVLCLEFKTLTETYTVSVATADGQVIYQKRVCSGSLLALDIDISDFTPGDYVCSVANAAETFWAPFSLYASAVHVVHDAASSTALFDLSGRRLIQRPSKGVYIENGCKRVAM